GSGGLSADRLRHGNADAHRRGSGRRCGSDRLSASLESGPRLARDRTAHWSARLMRRVTILGAGSWGTALAVHLGRVGHDVKLWARDPSLASDMAERRANAVYLPHISFPDSVVVTDAIEEALFETELIVSAIPSHGCRAV